MLSTKVSSSFDGSFDEVFFGKLQVNPSNVTGVVRIVGVTFVVGVGSISNATEDDYDARLGGSLSLGDGSVELSSTLLVADTWDELRLEASMDNLTLVSQYDFKDQTLIMMEVVNAGEESFFGKIEAHPMNLTGALRVGGDSLIKGVGELSHPTDNSTSLGGSLSLGDGSVELSSTCLLYTSPSPRDS